MVLAVGATARADGRWSLREAIQKTQAAQFEQALTAFDEAEGSHDLRRQDLARLYAYRAMVRFATGDRDQMEADLARLLAVEPNAQLPASAPPPVRKVFARLARLGVTAPRLVAAAAEIGGGLEVRASVQGGPAGLVHHVWVFARPGPGAKWVQGEDRVSVFAAPGVVIDWYAEAVGPGGAVLVSQGTSTAPQHAQVRVTVASSR